MPDAAVPGPPVATPLAGDERQLVIAKLERKRHILLRKVGGLPDEDLRRALPPSPLTLLGVLKHCAYVERWWFRRVFAGEDVPVPWSDDDPDAEFRIEALDGQTGD